MKISNLSNRAARYGVPKGWQLNEAHTALTRIPASEAGFRPEADHQTQQQLEQYYEVLEQQQSIDEREFGTAWARDRSNSAGG